MDTGSVRSRPAVAPRGQVLRDAAPIRDTAEIAPARAIDETASRNSRQGHQQPHDGAQQKTALTPQSGQALLQAAAHSDDDRSMPNRAVIRERAYRTATPAANPSTSEQKPRADLKA